MNTIYSTNDTKLVEGLVDLNRIEQADKEYFIGEFKHKALIMGKSKMRIEQSKEFDDILIGYTQSGSKPESQKSYMYYKGILFCHIGNNVEVVRKLSNGIGTALFQISPLNSFGEIYYEK